MENKFEAGGRQFVISKINAIRQFHIVRRIAPLLTELLPHLASLKKAKDDIDDPEKMAQLTLIATPILKGLATLSNRDSECVLYGLLSAAEMQQSSGNWAKVAIFDDNADEEKRAPGSLMINDMDLPLLLQVAGRVFVYNLSGFFAALPQ